MTSEMEGGLSRKVKETIAVLVSKDTGCDYCVGAHSAALSSIGLSREAISGVTEDLDSGGFTAREKALIGIARKANLTPLRIGEEQFQASRKLGVTDTEIVEALGVMGCSSVSTSFSIHYKSRLIFRSCREGEFTEKEKALIALGVAHADLVPVFGPAGRL